jgi:hypothetical protein
MTRRRKIAAATIAVLLLTAASAVAYFLILAQGEGEGHAKLGSASANSEKLTLTPSFADGLTPGKEEPLMVRVYNGTAHESDIRFWKDTLSIDAGHPGCSLEWFEVKGAPNLPAFGDEIEPPIALAPGASEEYEGTLKFIDNHENQDACEGATLTIRLTSTP